VGLVVLYVPYELSAVGAQQHPLSPRCAASNSAIPATVEVQASEAADRAAVEAGLASWIVNPGGVVSIPKESGGSGGHHAAAGAGGTIGAAVPFFYTSFSPDGIASMHQGHLSGQHSGRRNSQRCGYGQQYSQQNGIMRTMNGLYYKQ
jgi:hypothetical protein